MTRDADQLANLAAELDALDTPTSGEVLAVTQDYDAYMVAAEAAQRAINGGVGGGSQTLAEVLAEGNDAAGLTINGVGELALDDAAPGASGARLIATTDGLSVRPYTNKALQLRDHADTVQLEIGSDTYTKMPSLPGDDPEVADALWSDQGTVKLSGSAPSAASSLEIVRFPIAFDTLNIVTGYAFHTPAAGDLIIAAGFVVTTAWNGSTPSGVIFSAGGDDTLGINGQSNMTFAYDSSSVGPHLGYVGQVSYAAYLALDTTQLMVAVTDGSGGDPGSTAGEGEVVLVIAKAQ